MCSVLIDSVNIKIAVQNSGAYLKADPFGGFLQLPCNSKEHRFLPLLTAFFFFSLLEMADPEPVISSCSSREEENRCTFNQHTCPSEERLLEDQMRRKLKFFFMTPCEKFWTRGRKPWKLAMQVLKIAMVTIQVSISDRVHRNLLLTKRPMDSGLYI